MYRIEPFHEGFNTLGSINVSRAQTKASQGCLNEAAMGRYGLSRIEPSHAGFNPFKRIS